MKGSVPAEYAHVDERSAELGFTHAALFLVALRLLSSYLFEADGCLLLQGGRRASLLMLLKAEKYADVIQYVCAGLGSILL